MTIPDIIEGVYKIDRPAGAAAPLIFDSPHSGREYPDDFKPACRPEQLTAAEDNIVDTLFESAPQQGAALMRALFPRTYIDVNRAVTDIDAALMAEPWPGLTRPSSRAHAGIGLVRRLLKPGVAVYDRKLNPAEVKQRLVKYYEPYHAALAGLLDEAHYNFGQVWHIDCHSMPTPAQHHSPARAPDFVLGDRDGTACSHAFTWALRDELKRRGYRVGINDPYKGVEILRRYGRPAEGRHSLQLEISKALYWDEERQKKTAGFGALQKEIDGIIGFIARYVGSQSLNLAAD